MAIYDDMVAKLPAVMRQENVLKYYAAVAPLLEEFDDQLLIFENVHLVDLATGTFLDDIGQYVNVSRAGDNDTNYRARIKLEFYRYYFVPTLDNFLALINSFTGVYPDTIQTQNENFGGTEEAYIKFSYDFEPGFDIAIFDELDKLAGGGIRLENDILFIFFARNHVAGTTVADGGEFKRRITQRFVGS